MERNILYVLIDKDLEPIYGAVQGGHAVAEWLINQSKIVFNKFACEDQVKWDWNNNYLIYLRVDINKWLNYLREEHCKTYEDFYEPDLDYKCTAIAVHESGLSDYLKHMIKKEQLLM
jgi:hypothetical protein